MNILIISRCPPYPPQFGDRLILWHLARELKKHGHTLDIIAFSQFDTDADDVPHYDTYFRHIDLIPETPRSPIDYIKRALLPGTRFPKNASQAWSLQMWQMIEKRLSEDNYDVVHVFGGVQVYEFYQAIAHLPNIIVPYESYSLYLKRLITQEDTLKRRLMQRIAAHFERWMFAPYGKTVVLADPDRDELTRLNPALDVAIIPNGIDLDFFRPIEQKTSAPTLLFVGNYEYAPNIDAAILLTAQIFPAVQAQLPDAKLILAGKAPPENIKALASDAIAVTGWVDDIRDVYAQATIFVCPLRIGAGMKNKVLEALAMQIPVVASPVSVDGIVIEPGVHAIVSDTDTMAAGIIALLNDEAKRCTIAKAGRHLIEDRYSWSGVAEQYLALYKTL